MEGKRGGRRVLLAMQNPDSVEIWEHGVKKMSGVCAELTQNPALGQDLGNVESNTKQTNK
jgi:hypothetical protein